jgi:tetratricopeptide (TPR) repeat protein
MKLIGFLLLAATASAQIPAGARSADDNSQQEAINARITAAEEALEKGDYAAAEISLKALVTERPKDAHVLYDLGFAEEHNGELEAAAAGYTAAMVADPTLPEPAVALGLLDARANRFTKAHAELDAAARLTSVQPATKARALRALAQLDADTDPQAATNELLSAIDLTGTQPGDDALSAQLAEHAGSTADAQQAYVKALAADPDDIEARVGLAHTLKQQGKLADAETTLKTGLTSHPDDIRLVAELATVYVAENKDTDAIPLVEAIRAKDPQVADDPAINSLLAHLYELNNRLPEAETLDRNLLASHPNDPATLDTLGSVLVKETKYAEAQTVLTKAVSQRDAFHDDVAWGEAASHLAFAASKAGHPQVTLQALDARATVLPNSASSLFLRATANDSLHQRKQAIESYKAFLAMAGGKFPTEEFQARHRLVALQHEQ